MINKNKFILLFTLLNCIIVVSKAITTDTSELFRTPYYDKICIKSNLIYASNFLNNHFIFNNIIKNKPVNKSELISSLNTNNKILFNNSNSIQYSFYFKKKTYFLSFENNSFIFTQIHKNLFDLILNGNTKNNYSYTFTNSVFVLRNYNTLKIGTFINNSRSKVRMDLCFSTLTNSIEFKSSNTTLNNFISPNIIELFTDSYISYNNKNGYGIGIDISYHKAFDDNQFLYIDFNKIGLNYYSNKNTITTISDRIEITSNHLNINSIKNLNTDSIYNNYTNNFNQFNSKKIEISIPHFNLFYKLKVNNKYYQIKSSYFSYTKSSPYISIGKEIKLKSNIILPFISKDYYNKFGLGASLKTKLSKHLTASVNLDNIQSIIISKKTYSSSAFINISYNP